MPTKPAAATSRKAAPKSTAKTAAAKPATAKVAPKTTARSAAKPKNAAAPKPKTAVVAKPKIAAVAAEPKIAAVAAKPKINEESMNEVSEVTEAGAKVVAQMKVKDLIERVAAASDQNKKDVRAIVEATLAELGKALEAGESLNLPPFGRVRIANQKADASGQMMTLKLRRGGEKKPAKNDGEALAAADEAS